MSNLAQRSFAGGEICPALYARTDVAKYATALRACRNFIVNRFGGVSNRAGTEYAITTKNSDVVRPLPFALNVVDVAQSYVMVFGDHCLRFVQDAGAVIVVNPAAWVNLTVYKVGDLVSQGGVAYYCTTAHTAATATNKPGSGSDWNSAWYALSGPSSAAIYEIPTPYAAADLAGLQIQQSGDVVTIVHQNYATRELKRFAHTNWTLTLAAFGPSIGSATNLAAAGGAAIAGDTYYAVTAVSAANGDEGIAVTVKSHLLEPTTGNPITLTWDPVPGALSYVVYRGTDGQTFGFVGEAGGVPLPKTNTAWTSTAGTASTTTEDAWVQGTDQARITVLSSVNDRASDGTYFIAAKITVNASTLLGVSVDGRIRAFYSRDGEARVDAGIVATAHCSGAPVTSSFVGAIDVPDNGYASLVIDLVAEVSGDDGGAGSTFECSVSTASAPDNVISWHKTGTGFTDNGITVDFGIAPPTNPNVFASAANYPSVVGAFQQRRLLANTTTSPETVRASRTAVPGSFTTSTPIQDDDAVTFTLAGKTLAAIRHLVDIGRLVIFTAAGEWIVEGDNSNIVKPNAVNPRQFSAHGSSSLQPIVIGSTALFVHARSTIVRDLTADTVQGLSSNDLSVFAAHLFDGYSLVDWAFSEIPHHVVWVVRSDGTLLGLTYLPEQDVWGWHRHDTDGTIENVCVVPEGADDAVYLVVKRTVNGATVRYLERMAPRAITALTDVRDLVFMDAALTYDGRNFDPSITMTVSGGVAWDDTETVTVTRSAADFSTADVGGAVVFYDTDDTTELFRVAITSVVSSTIVTGHPSGPIPVSSRTVPTIAWGKAAIAFTGLDTLEGKRVSVLGDGAVIASPNNADYPVLTVASGALTLPQASVVVHVGLPYLCDLETLDIDTAQGPSLKAGKMLISRATFVVEKSRAFFVGAKPPKKDAVDPLEKLDQSKLRDVDDDYDLPSLKTDDFTVTLQASWNSNGRVFVRQPDPVPLSVLAIIPQGPIPPTN